MASLYEIKMRGIFGPEPGDVRKIDILRRTIELLEGGIEYWAGTKQARMLIDELGLDRAFTGKDVPGNNEDSREGDDEHLEPSEARHWPRARTIWPWTGWTSNTQPKKFAERCPSLVEATGQ